MTIKKINENQIKCLLTKEDLSIRKLEIYELAYDSEKVRALFTELLIAASIDLDFDTNGIPLIIEAIPMSQDSLMLLVTKTDDITHRIDFENVNLSDIDDGETPADYESEDVSENNSECDNKISNISNAQTMLDILNAFSSVQKLITNGIAAQKNEAPDKKEASKKKKIPKDDVCPYITHECFAFDNLSDIKRLANAISPIYRGKSTLYRSTQDKKYLLLLDIGRNTFMDFNAICNICSEYGTYVRTCGPANAFFDEHFKVLIKNNAIKRFISQDKH